MKIAIVGSGAAGLGAAWALDGDHEITLYEANDRLGGHAHTHAIDYDGAPINVDTGFIIFNEINYPNLSAMFAHLGVETKPTDMSLSISGAPFLEWTSEFWNIMTPEGLKSFDPKLIGLAKEIFRFNRKAKRDLAAGRIPNVGLSEYVDSIDCSSLLKENYLVPVGAAIWSMPRSSVMSFPAAVFISFFESHALLSVQQTKWRTVANGSVNYVKKIASALRGEIRLGEKVGSISRDANGVAISTAKENGRRFDHVVLACHSDEALSILAAPTRQEEQALGNIRYKENPVILHRDPALMPRIKSLWASWNCIGTAEPDGSPSDSITISYNMNRLQGIDKACPLFVTLQPHREPRRDLVFAEMKYHHPQFTKEGVRAQGDLFAIQGENRTTFAGAYLGAGFHEDAFGSGIFAASSIGANLPLPVQWGRPPYMKLLAS